RNRLVEPRRAGPLVDRRRRPTAFVLLVLRQQSAQVQQHRHARLRGPRQRREHPQHRHLPRFIKGREVAGARVRVFLGITGASGAPYAVRLLQALVAADCEVGVCASSSGIEVIGTEVYGDPRLPRDEVLARITEGAGDAVTVFDPGDWSSPYASG